jgi:mRNA-degrading endonuclease RelE of RelBE toxin-antitoxin system
MSEPYDIQYAAEAVNDLKALRAFDQRRLLGEIESHLRYQPRAESQSRIKAMAQPFWSHFRLRVDDFRVYYDVVDEPPMVTILRILEKGTGATPKEPS